MGMFDYIRCLYPFPDGFTEDIEYQTKDTEAQFLNNYTITKEGRLVHHTVTVHDVPKAERPYPEAAEGSFESFIGCMRSIPDKDVEVPFHGDLVFYTSNHSSIGPDGYLTSDGKHGWWREYTATFDHGTLVKIEGGATMDEKPPITREEFEKSCGGGFVFIDPSQPGVPPVV
jgi:hypothetical protein